MRWSLVVFVLLLSVPAAGAAGKSSVTIYLDGARVEREVAVAKGYQEVPLPRGAEAASLRVRPLKGGRIERVEVVPTRPAKKAEVELKRLTERREMLADRLKALEVQEEIFRAAAKTQSGKAPRKSKNNREPLEDIRKGTDFALARLEGVYHGRRKAESELKVIEERIAALRESSGPGGSLARIWIGGKGGSVVVSYLVPGLKWIPSYDFRVESEGEVQVVMNAELPVTEKGAKVFVVPTLLMDASPQTPLLVAPGGRAAIGFRFPTVHEEIVPLPQPAISFSFLNRSEKRLPPGEASCFMKGAYLGKTAFGGCLPGESRELRCGVLAPAK